MVGRRRKWLCLSLNASLPVRELLASALVQHGALGAWQNGEQTHIYFPQAFDRANVENLVRQAAESCGLYPDQYECSYSWQEEDDWLENWRQFFRPVTVGSRILVKPPWGDVASERVHRDVVVEIEPKMAFGTGAHASTQLCLEALEQRVWAECSVLDVGTGSGILAIAAAKLGAGCVVGFDMDLSATLNAQQNVLGNGVARSVHLFAGCVDALRDGLLFDVIVANVQKDVLTGMLRVLRRLMSESSILILSGLLEDETTSMREALQREGLRALFVRKRDEWVAIESCPVIG